MFKFFKKEDLNLPKYKIVTTWEHGDADSYTKNAHNFYREEDFLEYLKFFCDLEDKSYDACNDEEVYPSIVKEFFGPDAEACVYLEDDVHYSNRYARVENVAVEIDGIPQEYVNLEKVKHITLPEIGSLEVRSTWNTKKQDHSRWFKVPANVNYWNYQKDNKTEFSVKITHISVEGVYPKSLRYKINGVVEDGKFKGTLCTWYVSGYDPNFK